MCSYTTTLGKNLTKFSNYMTAVVLIACFTGCKTTVVYKITPGPVDVSALGSDFKAIGKDLTNSTPDKATLGKDLQQLSKDLPVVGQGFESLGTSPNNRFGDAPSALETNLKSVGDTIAAGAPITTDVGALGTKLSAAPPDTTQINNAQAQLGRDLLALGTPLITLGGVLADPTKNGGLNNDIAPASISASALGQHLNTLGQTLNSAPAGDPGRLLPGLGNDLLDIGNDLTPVRQTIEPNSSTWPQRVDLFGGIITLSPFGLAGPGTNKAKSFQLTNNSQQVFATIQINYHDRYAWDRPIVPNAGSGSTSPTVPCLNHWSDVLSSWDLQVRTGYVFENDQTNASVILGSGNFLGEVALGLRQFETADNTAAFVHSLNFPEFNVSMVTDRNFSQIHPAVTFGPCYVASFPSLSTNGPGRLLIRGGGYIDEIPQLTTGSEVANNGRGEPQYVWAGGVSFETEASFPFGAGKFLQAGARVYGGHTPDNWVVWAGATISIDTLAGVVQNGLGTISNILK